MRCTPRVSRILSDPVGLRCKPRGGSLREQTQPLAAPTGAPVVSPLARSRPALLPNVERKRAVSLTDDEEAEVREVLALHRLGVLSPAQEAAVTQEAAETAANVAAVVAVQEAAPAAAV